MGRLPCAAKGPNVEQGDASRLSAYAERFEKLRGRPLAEKCAAVNAAVNKDIAFVWDQWNYGIEERFAAPAETLREGRGDCEDYAIMKYFLLRHLDVPADNLLLAVVDIPDGQHMVLLAGEGCPSTKPETAACSWARARRASWFLTIRVGVNRRPRSKARPMATPIFS